MIAEGTRIGENTRIFKGAAIGLIPQDKKFAGEKTYTYIGKNGFIREFVTINRGTIDRGETRIGDNSWIMAILPTIVFWERCCHSNSHSVDISRKLCDYWAIVPSISSELIITLYRCVSRPMDACHT